MSAEAERPPQHTPQELVELSSTIFPGSLWATRILVEFTPPDLKMAMEKAKNSRKKTQPEDTKSLRRSAWEAALESYEQTVPQEERDLYSHIETIGRGQIGQQRELLERAEKDLPFRDSLIAQHRKSLEQDEERQRELAIRNHPGTIFWKAVRELLSDEDEYEY